MAVVVSVSVPDDLNAKWKQSDLKISPSQIFQIALETQLDGKNKHLQHWSSRALAAEKKLKLIQFARLKLIQFVYHRSMDDFDIIIVKYARIN